MQFQFDFVITDRTLILARLYLLQIILRDQHILTWDFFLNRFDTLCLEAQLDLESSGDIACLTGQTPHADSGPLPYGKLPLDAPTNKLTNTTYSSSV